MDVRLHIADSGEDETAYWLLVELLSPGGLTLDADRFRFAKQMKRILQNPPPDPDNLPPDWMPLLSAPREANIFDYNVIARTAARHFLRRQELIQRNVPGLAWAPAGWLKQQGQDLVLPPEDERHIPFLAQRHLDIRGAELLVDAPDVSGVLREVPFGPGTVTTIVTDSDGTVSQDGLVCDTTGAQLGVRALTAPGVRRLHTRFPLAALPAADTVSDVDYVLNVLFVGSDAANLFFDVQAYNQDGQARPIDDSCVGSDSLRYLRCADDASPYLDNITDYQTTGVKTVQLPTAANSDVESAKDAVDRFSVSVNENATTPAVNRNSNIEAVENAGTEEPNLIVTHAASVGIASQRLMIGHGR